MSSRRKPIASLSEIYRRYIPSIYRLAQSNNIQGSNDIVSTDDREIMAGHLLHQLLKNYCPKSALDYSRLVIDYRCSPNAREALDLRKENGITAPTILIVGTTPEVSFFIAADDMLFQVSGRFADALQSFMEMVFVSNVKYDIKTTGITYFFETLMNMSDKTNGSRQSLIYDLELSTTSNQPQTGSAVSPTQRVIPDADGPHPPLSDS
jgi:hypothetical protein